MRLITRLTWIAVHSPPRGVSCPRPFSSAAMWRRVSTPFALMSAMTGINLMRKIRFLRAPLATLSANLGESFGRHSPASQSRPTLFSSLEGGLRASGDSFGFLLSNGGHNVNHKARS